MPSHLFPQRLVLGVILVNEIATFAKFAHPILQFVLTQGCLVSWVNEGFRVIIPAQLMFSMGEMAFCTVKTLPRCHKVSAEFGFKFTRLHI